MEPLSVQLSAETFIAQYGRLSTTRLLDLRIDGVPSAGTATAISLTIADFPSLLLRGKVQRAGGNYCQLRVDLGLTERRALEDIFRQLKGGLPRAEPRYPTVFEVSLEGNARAEYARNVSRHGVFVATDRPPPVGTQVLLRLRLPQSTTPAEVRARIAWIGTDQVTGARGMGVEFVDVTPQLQERLDQLIASIRARSGKHALVADDDALSRQMLCDLLIGQGFEVREASNGAQALQSINEHLAALDLVLLDLMMPGMDGFDVLLQVREATRARGIPVVIVTGSDPEKARCALDLGADEAVLKGFSKEELLALLEGALSKRIS
ncbi:MAG: response regulator [Myxococcota bacterium]